MSNSPSLAEANPRAIRGPMIVDAVALAPLVVQMIPSAQTQRSDQDQVQLATTMRSLVLDQRHPIALEIAGTDQQRSLLIRARNHDDLHHVETQLHARLPHAQFVPLTGRDDPFHLMAGETVSVMELHPGQASYFPLQEFDQRNKGEDPLLGILGALDALPSNLRAIAQIALVPASPTWSRPYQRKALEHALEPERQQDRRSQATSHDGAGAPSTLLLVMGALFLAGYFLIQDNPKLMPSWLPTTFQAVLAGKWRQIWSGPHHLEIVALLGILLFLLALSLMLQRIWKRLMHTPMYDMHSVAEKTSRSAYHVRLRLYVIGPTRATAPQPPLLHRLIDTVCLFGHEGWTVMRSCVRFIAALRWKYAAETLLSLLRYGGKRVRQSRWGTLLRNAGRIGWAGLHSSIVHLRARQWKQAAKTLYLLVWLTAKGFWLLEREGLRTFLRIPWKQAAKSLSQFFWLLERRVISALFCTFKHRWQNWREERYQQARRRQILARLTAAYRQYHLASGNYFVPHRVRSRRAHLWVSKRTWWKGIRRSRHCIDVEALAALWHVPADAALPDLAHFAYRRSRSRLLPLSLKHAQDELSIGLSEHAGHQVAFGIPADCFESHMLIGGKSGEGKSTFILQLIRRRLREPGGFILIDPHGDLADQALSLIPSDRIDDMVFIDLSDENFACGINVLDTTMARGRDKIISDLIKIFSALWTSWGSRMEISFEYGLRTLYEANRSLCRQGKAEYQYTLLDLMPLLTDESFCHALLENIEDLFIRRWWASYYDPLSVQMQRDRVDPVLSKIAKFEGMIARSIVGQSQCSVDFAACIEQQKIVVIKLVKGVIGDDVARILGATLLGFLNVALEEQGKIEGAERKHIPIFIDEFQTLDGVNWSAALAELRKYGASYILATQSLEYLREKQLLTVVEASVKQLAIFRMSAEDAKMLHPELDVDPEDILHQESLTCYLKLLSRRQQHASFSCQLSFPPDGKTEDAQQIRMRSQRRYMRPVSEVSASINEHLARQYGRTPTQEEKKAKNAPTQHLQEYARENKGYRGRKSQEQSAQPSSSQQKPSPSIGERTTGELSPMNWEETVGAHSSEEDGEGHDSEEQDGEEREDEPDE